MNPDIQKRLEKRYPFMKDVYCCCSDGWADLIADLCEGIAGIYADACLEPDIMVDEVKSKYGGIRFYWSSGAQLEDDWDSADEAYREAYRKVYKKIEDMVIEYEELSETVCEECGKPASGRVLNGWVYTLCDDCFIKLKDKR